MKERVSDRLDQNNYKMQESMQKQLALSVKIISDVSHRLTKLDIVALNIPNGIPLVYELDDDLKPLSHYYLGDAQAAEQAAAAVASQGKA